MTEKKKKKRPGILSIHDKLMMVSGTKHLYDAAAEDANTTNMVANSMMDPKPRLRWTPELHERFVNAVAQLGGSESKFSHYYAIHPHCDRLRPKIY